MRRLKLKKKSCVYVRMSDKILETNVVTNTVEESVFRLKPDSRSNARELQVSNFGYKAI